MQTSWNFNGYLSTKTGRYALRMLWTFPIRISCEGLDDCYNTIAVGAYSLYTVNRVENYVVLLLLLLLLHVRTLLCL